MKFYSYPVVGLQYRMTERMVEEISEYLPVPVRLVREPDNEHDENAIAVKITDPEVPGFGMKIGFLPRQVAKVFAPNLDDGSLRFSKARLVSISVKQGRGEVKVGLVKRKISS